MDGMHWEMDGERHILCDKNGLRHAFVDPDPAGGVSVRLLFWEKPKRFKNLEEGKLYVDGLPDAAFYWPG